MTEYSTPPLPERRTLRSKAARAALWRAFDGRCALCGSPLGDDWEADHIVPWSVSQRTNIHEMQALCRPCNRRKGNHMLRKHQREFLDTCRDWANLRRVPKFTLMEVVTGGGKSPLPVIAAARLIPAGLIDAVCWVVPRMSLQEQGEDAFGDPRFRALLNHQMEARQATNEYDPLKGKSGYITTYQAIASDAGNLNRDALRRRRFGLFLDEPHHVEEGGVWHRAIQPLVDAATFVVLMTGTLERADGKRVAFVPYRRRKGGWEPDTTSSDEFPMIRYRRMDAIAERSIRRVEFHLQDGWTQWIETDGQTAFSQVGDAGKNTRKALFTALNTDFAHQLLDATVEEWKQYRQHNLFSKLLVVSPNISAAKEHCKWLAAAGVARVGIATSDDHKDAPEQIRRFKKSNRELDALDALVTVQMAYEGLDVPEISHIACLTHIRSRSWIEQMIGRGIRVVRDWGDWESQFCCVFAPNDALFNEAADKIRRDQSAFVPDERPTDGPRMPYEHDDDSTIIPIYGERTSEMVAGLGHGEWLTPGETQALTRIRDEYGLQSASLLNLRRMMSDLGVDWVSGVREERVTRGERFVPPSIRERQLRDRIEKRCKSIDSASGQRFGTTSEILKRTFGKGRADMNEQELIAAWNWVCEQARIGGIKDGDESYVAS